MKKCTKDFEMTEGAKQSQLRANDKKSSSYERVMTKRKQRVNKILGYEGRAK